MSVDVERRGVWRRKLRGGLLENLICRGFETENRKRRVWLWSFGVERSRMAANGDRQAKPVEEDIDWESVRIEVGDLGIVEQCDAARMRCAATRCGLESAASMEKDEVERRKSSRKLSRAVMICLFFMGVEVVGGLYANSLAILTDAAHLLTDVAGFALSLFAIWASGWGATPLQTFGYSRLEILGALGSILFIWLLTGILVYEAIKRLVNEVAPVNGRLMFCIAAVGLLVNLAMMFMLGHEGHGHAHGHGHGHSHDDDHSGHGHGDGRNHAHEGDHSGHGSESQHAYGDDQAESGKCSVWCTVSVSQLVSRVQYGVV